MKRFPRIVKDTSGATAIEYGLLLALISIGIVGALSNLGDTVSVAFGNFATMLNDSYGITEYDSWATREENGVTYTDHWQTTVNANGSETFNNWTTDANGDIWDYTGTLSYQGAIGGTDWTETGDNTYNNVEQDTFVQTNTGTQGNIGYSGAVDYSNAQGQTYVDNYYTNNNNNGTYTQYDTGTDWNGNAFSTSNSFSYSDQGSSTTVGTTR